MFGINPIWDRRLVWWSCWFKMVLLNVENLFSKALTYFHKIITFFFTGGFFSSLFSGLFGTREMRILILGLDGAGKTTILYRLQVGEVVTTIPSMCLWQIYIHNFWHVIMYCGLICNFFNLAIGFNVETVTYKNLKFQVWDLGGQTSIRQEVISFAMYFIKKEKPSWRCDVLPPQAVLAVLLLQHRCSDLRGGQQWPRSDGNLQIWAGGHVGGWSDVVSITSHNVLLLSVHLNMIFLVFQEEELKKAILVVFANKQDMEQAMTPTEVANSLGLPALKDRKWQIFKTSATKGTGLDEAMEW